MADNVEATIVDKMTALEDYLMGVPEYVELKRWTTLLNLHRASLTGADLTLSNGTVIEVKSSRPHRKTGKRDNPMRERILDLVESYLSHMGPTPTKTADLFNYLTGMPDIEIGGREPASNLSAMLHNSGRFRSHGRKGWTSLSVPIEDSEGDLLTPP